MNSSETSFPIPSALIQRRFLIDPSLELPKSPHEGHLVSLDEPISNLQFASMKIVVLALLNRIDALEAQAGWRQTDQLDLREEVNQFEAALIRAALTSTNGRQRRAARVLGMKVSTLNAKIHRYHVSDAG